MPEHPLESRVVDLEIRLTHQEATLSALGDTIVRQQRVMEELGLRITALRQQLLSGPSVASSEEEGPPPHY
ncbi:MAG: SlyX family protein [Acidiferrobacterales bacterium]